MKASEYITRLQELIQEYGDLEIEDADGNPVDEATPVVIGIDPVFLIIQV